MTLSYFLQTLVTGLSSGMVSYMMVSGMSLIISGMNMVNFGQGAFFVLGTYITYTVTAQFGFLASLIVAPLIVGLLGFLVEYSVRPLFGKNMLYVMLFTFGVAYIVCDGMVMIWGYSIRLLQLPPFLKGAMAMFGIRFPDLLRLYDHLRRRHRVCFLADDEQNKAWNDHAGHHQRP